MPNTVNKTAGYSLIEMMLGLAVATTIVMMIAATYIKHQKRDQIDTLAGAISVLADAAKKEYADTHGGYAGITTEWVHNVGVAPAGWVYTPAGGGNPASFATKISQNITVEAGIAPYSGMLNIILILVPEDDCTEITKKLFRQTKAIVIDGQPFKGSGINSLVDDLDDACGNSGGGNEMDFYF